jgi:carbonic anhydrase
MSSLIAVDTPDAILPRYRGTPIESLLQYQNLGFPIPASSGHTQLLISMCMDYRKELRVPGEFAYVLRSAGGGLRETAFEVSYAIAVGGVRWLAVVTHTDCGMAQVMDKREAFVGGLAEHAGWSRDAGEALFDRSAPGHYIGEAVAYALSETRRLRVLYPKISVAPLLYRVEDDRLLQILEEEPGPTRPASAG